LFTVGYLRGMEQNKAVGVQTHANGQLSLVIHLEEITLVRYRYVFSYLFSKLLDADVLFCLYGIISYVHHPAVRSCTCRFIS